MKDVNKHLRTSITIVKRKRGRVGFRGWVMITFALFLAVIWWGPDRPAFYEAGDRYVQPR